MGYFIHPCLGGVVDHFVNAAGRYFISTIYVTLHGALLQAVGVEPTIPSNLYPDSTCIWCANLTSPRWAHGAVGLPRRWVSYTRLPLCGGLTKHYISCPSTTLAVRWPATQFSCGSSKVVGVPLGEKAAYIFLSLLPYIYIIAII